MNEQIVQRGWEKLLLDLHLLLRPDTTNTWVRDEGTLCYSTGDPVSIKCDNEALTFLEKMLDVRGGSNKAHPGLCGFIRDIM